MHRFTGRLFDLDSYPVCDVEGTWTLHGGTFPYYTGDLKPKDCLNNIIRGWDYILEIEGGPRLQIVTSSVNRAADAPTIVRFSSQGDPLDQT